MKTSQNNLVDKLLNQNGGMMLNSHQSDVDMTTAFNSVFEIDEDYWYAKPLD